MQVFSDIIQGTPEWFQARAGIPTASEFSTVLAEGKGGSVSVTRRKYMLKLAGEVLTGEPEPEGYSNAYMDRGKALEDEARTLYAFKKGVDPEQVGFVRNGRKGASPDSLVGADGGLEIKTAIPSVQLDRLLRDRLPPEHRWQVQGGLLVTEREWWDFMSYCPGLPPLVVRVFRNEEEIAEIEKGIAAFNEELDAIVQSIRTYGNFKEAAAASLAAAE